MKKGRCIHCKMHCPIDPKRIATKVTFEYNCPYCGGKTAMLSEEKRVRRKRIEQEIVTLTVQELESIKEDAVFKEMITLRLKSIEKKLDQLNGIKETVASLEIHSRIQWALITLLLGGLIGLGVWFKF